MLEMVYSDLDNDQTCKDPNEVQHTRSMWRKFVWTAQASHASALAAMNWRDGMGPTVDVVSSQPQKYEENLSAPLRVCISVVEKLPQQVQHLEERMPSSSPRRSSISSVKSQHFPARGREYQGRTAHGTLWFYLHDLGEDMRKWDGETYLDPSSSGT